jgi:hypothetical protein
MAQRPCRSSYPAPAPPPSVWDGAGYSAIYDRTGKALALADSPSQTQVLLADLPLTPRPPAE